MESAKIILLQKLTRPLAYPSLEGCGTATDSVANVSRTLAIDIPLNAVGLATVLDETHLGLADVEHRLNGGLSLHRSRS